MCKRIDRNDARGIAQLMRAGRFKVVHVKRAKAQRLRARPGCRQLAVRKPVAKEDEIRGTLRGLGLNTSNSSGRELAAKVAELNEDADPLVEELMLRLSAIRDVRLQQRCMMDALLISTVRHD